jgi:hypothetical protein
MHPSCRRHVPQHPHTSIWCCSIDCCIICVWLQQHWTPAGQQLLQPVLRFILSCVCLLGAAEVVEIPIGLDGKLQLCCFCVFEGMVGIFWPSMMSLRSRFVPEELRSTIINIFRLPLNLFVCIILARVRGPPPPLHRMRRQLGLRGVSLGILAGASAVQVRCKCGRAHAMHSARLAQHWAARPVFC